MGAGGVGWVWRMVGEVQVMVMGGRCLFWVCLARGTSPCMLPCRTKCSCARQSAGSSELGTGFLVEVRGESLMMVIARPSNCTPSLGCAVKQFAGHSRVACQARWLAGKVVRVLLTPSEYRLEVARRLRPGGVEESDVQSVFIGKSRHRPSLPHTEQSKTSASCRFKLQPGQTLSPKACGAC